MRFVVLIFGLLGVAGSGYLGAKWISGKPKPEEFEAMKALATIINKPELTAQIQEQEARNRTAPVLLGSAVLGLIASIAAFKRKGLLAGLVFFVALALPIALHGDAKLLIFLFEIGRAHV